MIDSVCRIVFRVGYPLARLWWRLICPRHEGAIVAVYVGLDLLLVHCSYRAGWQLPGGGVRHGEIPEAAARRELAEEVGLAVPVLIPAGVACGLWDGRRDRVHFFELRLAALPDLRLDNREVIAARFVPPNEWGNMQLTGPTGAYLSRRRPKAPIPCLGKS